jgi:hypothetical protein
VQAQKPKVLYVMGTGRSGSTILGIALGNCEGVFCAGELHLWLGRDGSSPLKGEERARFWQQVREQVDVPEGFPGREARALEKSTAALNPVSRLAARRLRAPYRRITEDLYRAVARVSGSTHVVDTSHFPRRARQLQALEGIELYVLFVVRNPQSVVASYSRDDVDFPKFGPLGTNAYMWLSYLLSLSVFLRQPRERRLVVRYEQLMADPETMLREILDRVGSTAQTPDLGALRTGFAFQGNALLRKDVVALERQPEKPAQGSRLTAFLSLPWRAIISRLQPVASAGSEGAGRRG